MFCAFEGPKHGQTHKQAPFCAFDFVLLCLFEIFFKFEENYLVMPKLKIPQEQILADIKAGASFVKMIPDNIGEILYFDTNTPTDVPKSDFTYMLRKVAVFLLTAAAIAGLWYVLDSIVWRCIWTALVVLIGWVVLIIQEFSGTDYFVGTDGYAEFTFSGNRENVIRTEVHTFDESDLLLHGEIRSFTNGIYTGTNYNFSFLSSDPAGVFKQSHGVSSVYKHKEGGSNTGDIIYDFWCRVEQVYTGKMVEKYLKQLESDGEITFQVVQKSSIMKGTYVLSPALRLSPGVVKYEEYVFRNEGTVKPVIDNGELSFVVPGKKFFIFDGTETMAKIPLEKIVNRDAFLILLSKLF